MMLPACYVAVPYLIGLLARGHQVTGDDLALAGGLYLGFIGRILLKDFRDVRGDALFGKRTFLVRHGRRATCVVSATAFLAGTVSMVVATRHVTAPLAIAEAVLLACVLAALRALRAGSAVRREEALISSTAILGRGMLLLVLAHLSIVADHWSRTWYVAVLALLSLGILGQAARMILVGPVTRLTVPGWMATESGRRHPAVSAEKPLSPIT
jgi:4-hydroxybenzoate polyprenyltransferase